MRETTIARNYAEALLALARKSEDLQGWGRMIDDVATPEVAFAKIQDGVNGRLAALAEIQKLQAETRQREEEAEAEEDALAAEAATVRRMLA